ncbi:hypothetical protein [Bradyrhizobium sp. LMG 9283]|uniref:hypothetical protein n=1 Tax=Bradyrhizobium sp. LMG 9283 TaxID=592064 RepID=UPI00388E16DA
MGAAERVGTTLDALLKLTDGRVAGAFKVPRYIVFIPPIRERTRVTRLPRPHRFMPEPAGGTFDSEKTGVEAIEKAH